MYLFEQIVLWSCAAILTTTLALAITRLVIGPGSLDRVISLDTIVAVAQCAIALYIGYSLDTTTAPLIAALALIAFLGSVSVSRFRVPDSEEIPNPRAGALRAVPRISSAKQAPPMPWPTASRAASADRTPRRTSWQEHVATAKRTGQQPQAQAQPDTQAQPQAQAQPDTQAQTQSQIQHDSGTEGASR